MRGLVQKNHNVDCYDFAYSNVEGIEQHNGEIAACSDFRKVGEVDGY